MWTLFKRRPKLTWTEDELLELLQEMLERRGIHGSSNILSTETRQPHEVTLVYLWPETKKNIH